ncbi:MAG: hypothetical protein ACOCWM_06060 [Cyclobacteriaceae bacterium]
MRHIEARTRFTIKRVREFILFFSPTRKKTIETSTHIAHIAKAPQANTATRL